MYSNHQFTMKSRRENYLFGMTSLNLPRHNLILEPLNQNVIFGEFTQFSRCFSQMVTLQVTIDFDSTGGQPNLCDVRKL